MHCNRCNTETATRMRFYYDEKNQAYKEVCNECGSMDHSIVQPDVYFKGPYNDENLVTKTNPDGYVGSKRHKAQLLKELNLREAGGDKNPILGRPAPYIADPKARQRFFKDNYER